MAQSQQEPIHIPVLIVGGGGCGLTLSIFLSDHGVDHVLFEKHPGTSILPKAHYLNQRTMEIFRQHNFAQAIKDPGCPIRNMSRVDWRTSLGGDRSIDNRVICSVPAFGGHFGTPNYEMYRRDSAELSSNLPLLRLEPVLRKIAEERNPGKVLFSHEVVDFIQEADYVLATVRDRDGKTTIYRADFLVGADGGKTVGPKIGVEMDGPTKLVDFVSTHFKADLSDYWDDRTLITHFISPEGGSMIHFDCGALVQMGPTWGRHSEEWVLHFGFPVTDSQRFETDVLPDKIRELLKLPTLEMEVLKVSHWELDRVLASKYQQGRVFVAGDAAHRRPPTTGLGLNTAIEDSLNLAWKLAMVTKGKAGRAILDTFEVERRPVGLRNCDWGLFTFSNFPVLQAAIGLVPNNQKYNVHRFERIFEDSEYGEVTRHHIQRVVDTQDIEFSAHNIELGFTYEMGALVPDGTPRPKYDLRGVVYQPLSRPGHRLPHAWIEKDGRVISTHDLVGSGQNDLLLIVDESGAPWSEAVQNICKKSNLRIAVAGIKALRQVKRADLYNDHDDVWARVREISDRGAILVRQDNFVAWRSFKLPSNPEQELANALDMILCRTHVETTAPTARLTNGSSNN